jgi:hypothetical protein
MKKTMLEINSYNQFQDNNNFMLKIFVWQRWTEKKWQIPKNLLLKFHLEGQSMVGVPKRIVSFYID